MSAVAVSDPFGQSATFSGWALLPMLPPVAVRVRFLAPIEAPAEFVMSPVAVMLVPSSACSMSPVKVTGASEVIVTEEPEVTPEKSIAIGLSALTVFVRVKSL